METSWKVNYDLFSQTFSQSRKNMKWEEIEYFIEKYSENINEWKILDIWCGNGRLLQHFLESSEIYDIDYLWIDASEWMIREAVQNVWVDAFKVIDMNQLSDLSETWYDSIFCIASFHHLETLIQRENVLHSIFNKLQKGWFVFMTNWALESELNKEKYKWSCLSDTRNEFGGVDFQIKIWEFQRFYHSFSLSELEYLFQKSWFRIIENRIFDLYRNYISILQKI